MFSFLLSYIHVNCFISVCVLVFPYMSAAYTCSYDFFPVFMYIFLMNLFLCYIFLVYHLFLIISYVFMAFPVVLIWLSLFLFVCYFSTLPEFLSLFIVVPLGMIGPWWWAMGLYSWNSHQCHWLLTYLIPLVICW